MALASFGKTLRKTFQSDRTANFTESVIREMTRLAMRYGAVNLAQGFPDFPAPVDLKLAAIRAIEADHNQYSITWGAKPFRDAIAAKYMRTYGLEVDPEREITVTCGATEGMAAALLATTNPGDEVIVFEPFYESYHPDTLLCGADRKLVRLHAPDWNFDPDELRRAFSDRTKAIIVNTPHNPTGKVFTRQELMLIASLCQEFDALAITDEIYEHIVYDGLEHIPMITLPGMRERTILVNSLSKTFSVTGWRVGWAIAAPELTTTVRKVHDFLTVNAPTPLQYAGAMALNEQGDYFNSLAEVYAGRRAAAIEMLESAGFRCCVPGGAYYVMTDISGFGRRDDVLFAREMVEHFGVAGVPGSSFYFEKSSGSSQIRFCFCKNYATLLLAGKKLAGLRNSEGLM
jgi:aspartate/methionine/tyrosine aminotransferase